MIEINKKITDFNFNATSNISNSIYSYAGKNIILYFYPKDNTPGCTTQGNEFSDLYAEFEKVNICIFGISRDTLAAHEKFKAKYGFPFELISDSEALICNLFDVIKLKNMYGKKVKGIERSTFLINSDLVLKQVWRKVKAQGHAKIVLDAVQKLVN